MRFPDRSSADIAVPLSIYLPFFIFTVYFWYSSQTELKKNNFLKSWFPFSMFKVQVFLLHQSSQWQFLSLNYSSHLTSESPPHRKVAFFPLGGQTLCPHRGKSLCRDEWLLMGPVLLQHQDQNGNPLRPSARVQTHAWKITTSICVCV